MFGHQVRKSCAIRKKRFVELTEDKNEDLQIKTRSSGPEFRPQTFDAQHGSNSDAANCGASIVAW